MCLRLSKGFEVDVGDVTTVVVNLDEAFVVIVDEELGDGGGEGDGGNGGGNGGTSAVSLP